MPGKSETTNGAGQKHPLWPAGQTAGKWAGTEIIVTRFADHERYAPALIATALARGGDPALSHHFDAESDPTGANAVKVYDIETWGTAEARLINARALALFARATSKTAIVDASWASIYSAGNYSMPHSHPRNIASVLYMLDPGQPLSAEDGRFLFVDPRLAPCCRQQDGFMSTPSAPEIEPGTMVMFPASAVHMVTPFLGAKRRITMSWDLRLDGAVRTAVPPIMQRPGRADGS